MPPMPLLKYHLDVQKSCCMVSGAMRLKLFTAPPPICAENDPHVQTGPILHGDEGKLPRTKKRSAGAVQTVEKDVF